VAVITVDLTLFMPPAAFTGNVKNWLGQGTVTEAGTVKLGSEEVRFTVSPLVTGIPVKVRVAVADCPAITNGADISNL
jgi:hypothetical protein